MNSEDSSADALLRICTLLEGGDHTGAQEEARGSLPFTPGGERTQYRPNERRKTQLFIRDGFIDRYTGKRVVYPPALLLLSHELPTEIPYHSSWRYGVGHPIYWELYATVDHGTARAVGGTDSDDNWFTCSMATNQAKGSFVWTLLPAGDVKQWDGLLGWFVRYTAQRDVKSLPHSVRKWLTAAQIGLETIRPQ